MSVIRSLSQGLYALSLVSLSSLYSCTPANMGTSSLTPVARSKLTRQLSPSVSEADLATVVRDNQAFAFDLYQHVIGDKPDENAFYSPHSLSSALAMVYAGAKEDTAEVMKAVLHFTLPEERLHSAFNALDLALRSRAQTITEVEDAWPFTLRATNRLWGLKYYPYEAAFLNTLALHYGAGVHLVDFVEQPEATRSLINAQVALDTDALIKELIPQGGISNLTRLVLTNTMYFKANWETPFRKDATAKAPFQLLSGQSVDVDFMRTSGAFDYAQVDGHDVVELPYAGKEVSMLVIVPQAGTFETFEKSFDDTRYQAFVNALRSQQGNVTLPRFDIDVALAARTYLIELGMDLPFMEGQANFKGITTREDLFIQDVIHKGVIKVSEEGTEAAAATAVVVDTDSAMPPSFDLNVNRPFLFVIRDIPTGALLFVGRVVSPE